MDLWKRDLAELANRLQHIHALAARPRRSFRLRFSLFGLFVATTLMAASLGMVVSYGYFGIVFLLPHLAVVTLVGHLIRRRCWSVAFICGALYLASWAVTAVAGVTRIHQEAQSLVTQYGNPGEQVVNYDPMTGEITPAIEPPWWFVGHEAVPCPFVVTVYCARLYEKHGTGYRAYFMWFFDNTFQFKIDFEWSTSS